MPIRIDKLSGFAAGSASLPLGRDSKKGGRLGQGEEAMAVEPNEIACDAEVRSCQHTHVLNQAHDTRQPQGPVLHGLFDPSYFHDFQRRLREEVATSQQLKAATNDSEASSGNDRQAPRVFSKDESQKTESEGEGEDIEEAEFKIADETSDEETSQDRAMIDDAPQEEENEVVRCCRMNAAMETDSEAEGFSQVLARLKRRAPGGATSPLQSRRRRRVLLSSSDSSGEEEDSPSQGRSQAVSVEHPPVPKEGGALGTDCQMLDDLSPELEDDGWSDDLPPEPEDDGWSDLFDLSLEDDFAKSCVIVPRLRWASRQTTAANGAPTALDAAGQASLEPPTSLSAPIPSAAAAQSAIRAAQQEQNTPAAAQGLGRAPNSVPAPARSATPAAPEPDVAAPRYPPPSSTSQPPPSPPIVSKGSAVQETVPPRQVPSPTNMGGPSRVDPILAAAHHFHTMGVASLTFNMKVWLNDKGEEKKAPAGLMREWQNKCDLGNCLREGVRPGRGCVAIVTEPSDIYALDVDTKDGGVEAFERMLEEHGPLPDDTPWEWSGNRPGRHFFFSLSQSKAAGLLSGAGRTRLTYKGVKVGLDMRGEGGMLFVGPTSYKGSDGAVRQYEWVQEIAPDRSNLRALPPWLIVIINASDVPQAAPRSQDPVSFFVARSMDEPDSEEIELPPQPVVLERIKKSLAGLGDSCSRFDKLKRSPAGDMYVFRVSGAHVCPYGVNHSGSNNFCVLVRGGNLLCKCNSPECCDMHPLRKIGELSAQESMMGGETAPVAEDDTTVYKELTKPFVDYWVFRGDMGGSRIVAQMYSRCHR